MQVSFPSVIPASLWRVVRTQALPVLPGFRPAVVGTESRYLKCALRSCQMGFSSFFCICPLFLLRSLSCLKLKSSQSQYYSWSLCLKYLMEENKIGNAKKYQQSVLRGKKNILWSEQMQTENFTVDSKAGLGTLVGRALCVTLKWESFRKEP